MTDAEGVQQELQDYLQKKGINTLFINLVESLLLAKPENPIVHIIQYLQANYPDQAAPKKMSFAQMKEAADPASSHHSGQQQCECDRTTAARAWRRPTLLLPWTHALSLLLL